MKACEKCGTEFSPYHKSNRYCSSACRNNSEDKRKGTKAFQAKRREWINSLKLAAGCSRCGYKSHPAALDFNHVRGTKRFNVSHDPKVAKAKLLAEIEKCEVLCANCHRVETYENKHWHTKRTGVVCEPV